MNDKTDAEQEYKSERKKVKAQLQKPCTLGVSNGVHGPRDTPDHRHCRQESDLPLGGVPAFRETAIHEPSTQDILVHLLILAAKDL